MVAMVVLLLMGYRSVKACMIAAEDPLGGPTVIASTLTAKRLSQPFHAQPSIERDRFYDRLDSIPGGPTRRRFDPLSELSAPDSLTFVPRYPHL
jgi:hypothetical protein